MAYKAPRIRYDEAKRRKVLSYGDCNAVGHPRTSKGGKTRYCVTCDAIRNGKAVVLEHPWRAYTHEGAINAVKKHHKGTYDGIRNCNAVEIPGSYKKP